MYSANDKESEEETGTMRYEEILALPDLLRRLLTEEQLMEEMACLSQKIDETFLEPFDVPTIVILFMRYPDLIDFVDDPTFWGDFSEAQLWELAIKHPETFLPIIKKYEVKAPSSDVWCRMFKAHREPELYKKAIADQLMSVKDLAAILLKYGTSAVALLDEIPNKYLKSEDMVKVLKVMPEVATHAFMAYPDLSADEWYEVLMLGNADIFATASVFHIGHLLTDEQLTEVLAQYSDHTREELLY